MDELEPLEQSVGTHQGEGAGLQELQKRGKQRATGSSGPRPQVTTRIPYLVPVPSRYAFRKQTVYIIIYVHTSYIPVCEGEGSSTYYTPSRGPRMYILTSRRKTPAMLETTTKRPEQRLGRTVRYFPSLCGLISDALAVTFRGRSI